MFTNLPSAWQVVEFGSVLDGGTRNGIYKQPQFRGSGFKMVNMGELFAYPRLRDVPMSRIQLTDDEAQRFNLQVGDLLYARRSLVAEGAGKCSIVYEVKELLTFESSIIRARPKPEIADSLFLYYLFNSPIGNYLLGTILRQVAVAGITGTDLVKLKIPLPPLPEQRAIAGILGALDDKIELNRRMNRTLESMAQAVFRQLIVESEEVDGCKVGRVEDICVSIENGGTPKRMEPEYWNGGTISWFKTGELTDTALITSEEKITTIGLANSACRLWDPKTVLIALYASPTVGRLGILEIAATANQACSALVAKPEYGYLFLFYSLLTSRDELQRVAVGAAQQNINQSVLRSHKIVIPPLELVKKFHKTIEPLYSMQLANIKESRTLANLRDSLLPKLMKGEVRVRK